MGLNSQGNVIQGNSIGTDLAGEAALSNGVGVFLNSAVGNLVGGAAPARGT